MYGLIWEYFITPAAFEVRLFRFLLVYRLRKENIVAVHAVEGVDALEFGSHPFNSIALGNRWQRRWVLIEKRYWPRFLDVTPKKPDQFVEQIRTSVAPN